MSDVLVRRFSATVVVVCVAALAATVALVLSPSLREWTGVGPRPAPPAYAVGDRVDVDAGAYTSSPLSLILFARSTCAACQRSSDFHKQVVAAGRARGVRAALVTPSDDASAEQAYAANLGIGAAQVYHAAPGSIKLRAVPALMVVDAAGVIRHVWFGAPDAGTQAEILTIVTALATGPQQ